MEPAALTDPKWEPNRLLPSPPFSLRESFSPCQRIHTKPTDPCVGSPSTCVFITQVSSFNLLMMSSSLLSLHCPESLTWTHSCKCYQRISLASVYALFTTKFLSEFLSCLYPIPLASPHRFHQSYWLLLSPQPTLVVPQSWGLCPLFWGHTTVAPACPEPDLLVLYLNSYISLLPTLVSPTLLSAWSSQSDLLKMHRASSAGTSHVPH